MDDQGNLERSWKVRKMAMAGRLKKIYLFCAKGENMYFLVR